MTEQINSQNTTQGTCHVWADPHLVMFPINPGQADLRTSYWCQTPGRMLILKNKYIEVSVDVTGIPFWNEDVSNTFHSGLHRLIISFSLKSHYSLTINLFVRLHLLNRHVKAFVRHYDILRMIIRVSFFADVDVISIGSAIELLYYDADNLSLSINSYVSLPVRMKRENSISVVFSRLIIALSTI